MPPISPQQQPSGSRLNQLMGDLDKLPLFPATAQQIIALTQQESTSLDELCRLLETDVMLATSVLKLANSPLLKWGQPFDSLERAVVWLGLRECRDLIVAISMRNVFHRADPATKGFCAVLWHHCFLTACICRRLNRELALDFQGQEFLAGLLHDLGRILVAITLPGDFPAANPMDFIEADGVLQREAEVTGTDHCLLGGHYGEHNSLPASSLAAIRYHHRIENEQIETATDHAKLVGLVATADHLANSLQRCQNPRTYDLSKNPGFAFMSRDWSGEKKASFAKVLPKVLIETNEAAARQANPNKGSTGRRDSGPIQRQQGQKPSLWGSVKSALGG